MLTKPRTVCFCHDVSSMISARVAPFARFIIAMTSAFLLLRSAAGLAAFLAGFAFFVALAFFAGLTALAGFFALGSVSGCRAAAGVVSTSVVMFDIVVISFATKCLAVVTFITPVRETSKAILRTGGRRAEKARAAKMTGPSPF